MKNTMKYYNASRDVRVDVRIMNATKKNRVLKRNFVCKCIAVRRQFSKFIAIISRRRATVPLTRTKSERIVLISLYANGE